MSEAKIGITCDQLAGLHHTARRNGTLDEFGDLAVGWAKKAAAEIDRLRAENEALRHGLIAIKAHQEMLSGAAVRYSSTWQMADKALRGEVN